MRGEAAGGPAVAEALADVAALGPFFALPTGPAGRAGRSWRRLPDGLPALIAPTAARLGTAETRVAASTAHLALAARLWSPVLGCALLHGVVPDLTSLRYRTDASGGVALWLPQATGRRAGDPEELAAAVHRSVVVEQLAGLNAGMRRETGVAAGLLWGNAASAMIGALRVLTGARPALLAPARDLATRLLATGPLCGSGTFTGPGLCFRRRSCCLYYRVRGGGLCGDCCLDAVPER